MPEAYSGGEGGQSLGETGRSVVLRFNVNELRGTEVGYSTGSGHSNKKV